MASVSFLARALRPAPTRHALGLGGAAFAAAMCLMPLRALAQSEPIAAEPVGTDAATLPHDLSPYGMFITADWVVKTIMLGLIAASAVTWVIFIAKSVELFLAERSARRAIGTLREAKALPEAAERFGTSRQAVARLLRAMLEEQQLSGGLAPDGIKERASLLLSRLEADITRRSNGGTAVLATIGAIAPFVGLLGTVWGIMNSFIGISMAKTTNLAVVAPGIAEALLATAIGLFAAIPAVVIYNYFSRSIGRYRALLADASALLLMHLSRDLDRAMPPNVRLVHRSAAAE